MTKQPQGETVFDYYVNNLLDYEVVKFGKEGRTISIEEKLQNLKSNYSVTGLYFYDNQVINFVKKLKPSTRGKLEITDVNRIYLEKTIIRCHSRLGSSLVIHWDASFTNRSRSIYKNYRRATRINGSHIWKKSTI